MDPQNPPIDRSMPVGLATAVHGAQAVAQAILADLPPEVLERLGAMPKEEAARLIREAMGLPSSPRPPVAASPRLPVLAGHAYAILARLRNSAWQATAVALNDVGGLNYRARISDLRHVFGVDIVADPPHPAPGQYAVYHVPAEHRPRAEHLLQHLSLAGYRDAPRQTSLLDPGHRQSGQ